jgi:type I restriction enzyme M protein
MADLTAYSQTFHKRAGRHNPEAVMRVFGQELNPESYAICKADMLIKGQDVLSQQLGHKWFESLLLY